MKGLKAYRSLNAEQKRALRDKRLEMNRSVPQLLEFLRPLAACDAMSDRFRTTLGCTFAFTLVLSIVLAIVFLNSGWQEGSALVVIPPVLFAIASFVLWRWTRGIDVSNNIRQFALPVLTVLRDDFDPAQPVHVRLDLSAPTAPAKKRGADAAHKKGTTKIVDATYVDEWMSLEGVLVDGTKLSWRVVDSIRERKKTRRNARGKIKTKTKYKKKTDIEVSMGLRKKTYALTKTVGEVSSDEKRHVVAMTRRVITPSLDPLDRRALLDLLADVFRSARPAKEGA